MKKQKAIELHNVCKKYGDDIIFKNVNLTVYKGEIISIVGRSGSGKSTLLKCLNLLEKINSGDILLGNNNINDMSLPELRQKVGLVFQDYNLFNNLNVLENLTIGLIKIKKYGIEESKEMSLNMLKKIGLIDKKEKYPDELSGGQKQRVAIARTLLMKPDVILLDEPTSALDNEMKKEVLELLLDMINENMTIIIVSHEEDFVKKISDRIFKMKNYTLKEF